MDKRFVLSIKFYFDDYPALRAYRYHFEAFEHAELFIEIDDVESVSCYLVGSDSYDFQFRFKKVIKEIAS